MAENTSDEIKLKVGESTQIKLSGLGTAGYQWNYTIDDNKDCVDISKELKMPENIPQQNAGASANEIFTITAKKQGIVIIHFTQKRSWEKNVDPINEKTVKIIIE